MSAKWWYAKSSPCTSAYLYEPDQLPGYVLEMEFYYVDETDQLAIDNPALTDYLDDVLPDMTAEEYGQIDDQAWLDQLRKIIEHAKTFVE